MPIPNTQWKQSIDGAPLFIILLTCFYLYKMMHTQWSETTNYGEMEPNSKNYK